jgi:hypothetical protein
MAKATIKRRDGAIVTLEGSPEELKRLLTLDEHPGEQFNAQPRAKGKKDVARTNPKDKEKDTPDLTAIVKLIKTCKEAAAIENNILDRSSQVDRTLLPLYINHVYLDDKYSLTTGDISKVLKDLNIRITQPNASKTFSGVASKYILGDTRKVWGVPVHYKLSRRGAAYLKEVISGKQAG